MSIPKIPADGFMLFNGVFGFSIGVQQAEFPTDPQGNAGNALLCVVEEIRVSPQVAKILLQTLALNIENYENLFGEIKGHSTPLGRAN